MAIKVPPTKAPLTKSLHTITAVTNVAKFLLHSETSYTPEGLAQTALEILGYNIDTRRKGDPTVDRIVENCRILVQP